jgi:hypothetical protein
MDREGAYIASDSSEWSIQGSVHHTDDKSKYFADGYVKDKSANPLAFKHNRALGSRL